MPDGVLRQTQWGDGDPLACRWSLGQRQVSSETDLKRVGFLFFRGGDAYAKCAATYQPLARGKVAFH